MGADSIYGSRILHYAMETMGKGIKTNGSAGKIRIATRSSSRSPLQGGPYNDKNAKTAQEAPRREGRGMKSKELAELTGVTVRTLRHYHQIGLLPEPPRSPNGYRAYRAIDAARVLRIRSLVELGMSLSDVAAILEEEGGSDRPTTQKILSDLDGELAAQIRRLKQKRRTIALLRERGFNPDAASPFGDHLVRMKEQGSSTRLIENERAGLLLIEQIFPPESKERKRVERFISLVKKTDALSDYIALSERLVSLGDDASEMVREALAADLIAWMKRLIHAADKENPAEEGSSEDGNEDAYGILDMFDRETLNQAQMDVSLRVQKALASAFGSSS